MSWPVLRHTHTQDLFTRKYWERVCAKGLWKRWALRRAREGHHTGIQEGRSRHKEQRERKKANWFKKTGYLCTSKMMEPLWWRWLAGDGIVADDGIRQWFPNVPWSWCPSFVVALVLPDTMILDCAIQDDGTYKSWQEETNKGIPQHPYEFAMAPSSTMAHSLRTTGPDYSSKGARRQGMWSDVLTQG